MMAETRRDRTGAGRVVHVDPETKFSGGEVQVLLLMEGLRDRGWRQVLFCGPRSALHDRAREGGIEVRPVRMRNDIDFVAVLTVHRMLHRESPDLVHLHTGRATWLGGMAAKLAGIPAITTRRMDRPVARDRRTRFVYGRLVRRTVAISPAVARCLEDGGVARRRTSVIHSAVDPDAVRPDKGRQATRAALGATEDEPVLLALCALVRRKGLDVLLRALGEFGSEGPRPLLWVAGEGPERGALEEQARRLGFHGRVRFLGRRADKADLLAACDVLVLPSRREGLGVAVLEAMAAERPVVASAVGGLQEAVVDDETGILVPADDVGALQAALSRLVADAALRERLGRAGAERIRALYLPDRMAAAYDALYREVLAEWRGR